MNKTKHACLLRRDIIETAKLANEGSLSPADVLSIVDDIVSAYHVSRAYVCDKIREAMSN